MSAPQYQWVTVRETPDIVDNQFPGQYVKPLFHAWTKEGWEIVSVMTLPADPRGVSMCIAVGVLRKAIENREVLALPALPPGEGE